MGESQRRRDRFLRDHPTCCFCGGRRAAETEDHQPARVFFAGRNWPEGFAFPACARCNSVSRESERVMALLIHGESGSEDRKKFQEHAASLDRAYPSLISSMLPSSSNEVRSILRSKQIPRPQGVPLGEIPIVKLDRDFWEEHFNMFARKLFLALHYQCYSTVLPPHGAIWAFPATNADLPKAEWIKDFARAAEQIAIPIRNGQRLGSQFSVRWNVVPGHNSGLFVAQFHGRMMFAAITTDTPELFGESNELPRLTPFSWDELG